MNKVQTCLHILSIVAARALTRTYTARGFAHPRQ